MESHEIDYCFIFTQYLKWVMGLYHFSNLFNLIPEFESMFLLHFFLAPVSVMVSLFPIKNDYPAPMEIKLNIFISIWFLVPGIVNM